MKTQKEYALEYYRKNKEMLNKKRRENYGEKEKEQAKLRRIRFKEKHGIGIWRKYYKKSDNHKHYINFKSKYPEKYLIRRKKFNEWRKIRIATDPIFKEKERQRCLKNSICRIHNSRSSGIKLTKSIIEEIYKKYQFMCAVCNKTNKETKLSIDHIKPICKGGTNDINNLQILCLHCNQVKSGK